MSIAPAEKEIARFLSTETPEVLCFKGKWGVGKTYAWNTYLKQAKDRGGIALRRYSYVSLFGLGSIDQLKLSIVENTVARARIGEAVTIESILANPLEAVGRWRRLLTQMQITPIPGAQQIAAAIQSSSFLSVRDQVVCLDDLERKGDALKIKDVLGLVSLLKEDRRCKIAIILNDGAFAVSEKDEFETFFEKTIDSHVEFMPTPQECAMIALPTEAPMHVTMRACCEALQIQNIRVVKRIERLTVSLRDTLAGFDERVLNDAYKTLTLLGWSIYSEGAAPIDFIVERRAKQIAALNAEPPEKELRWGALLDAYDFLYFSEFDKLLKEGVHRGYFDSERLRAEAIRMEVASKAQQLGHDYSKAWRLYHDSFADNEGQLVQSMFDSFKAGYRQITPMNANGTVSLLRELGHHAKADELIAFYVANVDDRALDRRHWFSNNDVTDATFLKAIEAKLAKIEDKREPLAVLSDIGLPHVAVPELRLESGRYWPASGLAGAQRRAEQMLAARLSRVLAGDSRARNAA